MKKARNEIEAWQEMDITLPAMSPEERAEYERGPSPWPAVIAIGGVLVLWVLSVYVFV